MNDPDVKPDWSLSDAELRESVEAFLGPSCPILSLSRCAYAYRTSYPLEEISLRLANGSSLDMLCKCTSWNSLTPAAQQAKPSFLHDPLREIETYRLVLSSLQLGAPSYYGSVQSSQTGWYWLFVEKVAGTELYQIGELKAWQDAARWLAGFHSVSSSEMRLRQWSQQAHLLALDERYYRRWLTRAVEFAREADRPHETQNALCRLAERLDPLFKLVKAVPSVLVHGEFYASNVLMQQTPTGVRIAPVDWEMAGVGPCLVDLAALTAGKWKPDERQAIALAYHAAVPRRGNWPPAPEAFLEALDACRLLLALQWLGWSPEWVPPREHRHDWLAEALDLADKLRL